MQDVLKKRPLNLGLNDGTHASEAAMEVMRAFAKDRTGLRNYSTADNDPLREAIAHVDGVTPRHVYVQCGSGPILKQCVTWLIRNSITSSPRRIASYALRRGGYSIITPRFTYSKVPKKASGGKIRVEFVPLAAENGFTLDMKELDAAIGRRDGLVYIANPNNPTGNVLLSRDQLEPLLQRYPDSIFWIDEAYVQYVDPAEHRYVSDLVPKYDNLFVSRTFSFAHGMAAMRIGYLLGPPTIIETFESQVVNYRIGALAEAMAVAALEDEDHLPFVRKVTAEAREQIRTGLAQRSELEAFDSTTNFILFRFRDGRNARFLAEEMKRRGILIKVFEPFVDERYGIHERYDEYFRLTVGLPAENERMVAEIIDALDKK